MTTTFNIKNSDKCSEYVFDQDKTIIDLKKIIIRDFSLKTEYIDLNFILERPIRSLGKFNLESGILPRTLDMYPLNRFGLEGKTIDATYIIVNDYKPFVRSKKPLDMSKYKNKIENEHTEEHLNNDIKSFNINSLEDFPKLG